MRLRSTLPATAAALLVATLAVPAQAMADTPASPTPSDTSSATATPTDSPTPTPTDTATSASPAPAPVVSTVTPVDLPTGRVLQVAASSVAGVDHLTATFSEDGGTTTAGTAGGFTLISGTVNNGVWQSGVIQLPDYVTYTDSVQAFDSAQTASTAVTGTMDYYKKPVFDPSTTITPSNLAFGSETVTASGKLDTWDPASGLQTNVPYHSGTYNEPINLLDANNQELGFGWDLGGSDGSFSITYKPAPGSFTSKVVTLQAVDPHGNVTGPSAAVNEGSLTQTRIVLDHSSTTTIANANIVVSGTVQYLDSTTQTWKPAADQAYMFNTGGYWNHGSTTDASGRFSFNLQTSQVGTWQVATDSGSYNWDQWLASSVANFSVTSVTQVVSLNLSSPSIDEYSDLTFQYSANSTNNQIGGGKVYVLESPDGRTGWKNLGYIPTGAVSYKQVAAWVDNPHGYWRLWYPGAPGYEAAYSNVIHTFRYSTLITGAKPSTTWAYKGQVIRFSGGLWDRGYGAWGPMRSTRVYLFFRPYRSNTWYYEASSWTNSGGYFNLYGRAETGGTWEVAWFTGNSPWFVDAYGPGTYVHA
ncbi:hypothetical protein [Streptacidiphilus fuscans]|uniref:Uncharacterized protein n=1 Tax=Streptacidiphilus fuscans TaxID=2789292 RepID=A0A931B6H3_9ACTN|nr:hypothetical protein [Streptacidiphilus fuscans]MBF9067800.1 hypothetical protein [Streptacidiphilus fuscans]MBF9073883.1 hypothetical protein [Streptacidiphilus fuscans]